MTSHLSPLHVTMRACLAVYRSQGPVVLRHHNGCVSACDFAKDGQCIYFTCMQEVSMQHNKSLSL